MVIREITINDAEDFIKLTKAIDESGFMLFEPDERQTTIEQQKKAIENILYKKNSMIYVAELDHQLVGYMLVLGGELKRTQHSAYLVLGVHNEFQGRGIATKLFNQVFTWAKDIGLSRLGLTVIKDNEKAINLYKKMGFEIEGEKVHSLLINGRGCPKSQFY